MTQCNCSALSPFRWRESPASECGHHFYVNKSGKTQSQTATEAAEAFQERTGRSMGSVHGINAKADKTIERGVYERRAARG